MTSYEIYVIVLCSFVFLSLVLLFSYIVASVTRMRLKMIKHGLEDNEISKEKQKSTKANGPCTILLTIFTWIMSLILCCCFAFSIYVGATANKSANGVPSIKVVKTASMATKNENNKYLFDKNLNNQIQTFDLIITYHLPKEEDLKLYDIVVYEKNGTLVIHRIVGIEEPNEKHPNQRHFLFQGDAVARPDQFPVLYSQMRGIYTGQRIPFVGSFILFLQSPAGWLCIMLVMGALIVTPIIEKKIAKERQKRLAFVNQTGEPKSVKVVDVYNAIDSNGKYFYTDESGIKIYSSCPIQVKRADGIINPNDIPKQTDMGDKK